MRSTSDTSFIEQARRTQILGATVDLLAEGGFGAASLSAIAERIGSSKGVISYHFAGKDDLLRQVVTQVLADAESYMAPRVEAADGPVDKLRVYIESNMQFLDGHRSEIRALTAILTGLPPSPDGAPAYATAGRAAVDALATLLREGQRSGAFRQFQPLVVARSVRASIDAVSELLRVDPGFDLVACADELRALFEPGILA